MLNLAVIIGATLITGHHVSISKSYVPLNFIKAFLVHGLVLLCGSATAATLIVPDQHDTIQEAINASTNLDDIVLVRPGLYTEPITLTRQIILRGEDPARTLLMSEDLDPIILIAPPQGTIIGPQDIVIQNFTFIGTNDGGSGISITDSGPLTIRNNIFRMGDEDSNTAILVTGVTGISILHNTFYENDIAIDLPDINNTTIEHNIFAANTTAVQGGSGSVNYNCFDTAADKIGVNDVSGDVGFANVGAVADTSENNIVSGDFHLRTGSVCRDVGDGSDLDGTEADMGAYGGDDDNTYLRPYQVGGITATAGTTATPGVFDIAVMWQANNSYHIDFYNVYHGATPPAASNPPEDVGNVTSFNITGVDAAALTPAIPQLQSLAPSNQNLSATWSAAQNATGYRVYYGIADITENAVDVGNVTSYRINNLTNGTVYRVAVSAISQPQYFVNVTANIEDQPDGHDSEEESESVLGPQRVVNLGDPRESILSNELTALPETVEPYPPLPDQGGALSLWIALALVLLVLIHYHRSRKTQ